MLYICCQKLYWKSSSCFTEAGDDLLRGNWFPRESPAPLKEVVIEFTICPWKGMDEVILKEFLLGEETEFKSLWCLDKNFDLESRFCLKVFCILFPSLSITLTAFPIFWLLLPSPLSSILGFTLDSIGTSFPSTWLVKTNLTCNILCK